jgi:hypothetical protein
MIIVFHFVKEVIRGRLNTLLMLWMMITSSNRVANFFWEFFYIRSWTQYLRFTTTPFAHQPIALDLPDILLGLELLLRCSNFHIWPMGWSNMNIQTSFPYTHTKLTWTNKLWNTNTSRIMVSWCQTIVGHVSNTNTCD